MKRAFKLMTLGVLIFTNIISCTKNEKETISISPQNSMGVGYRSNNSWIIKHNLAIVNPSGEVDVTIVNPIEDVAGIVNPIEDVFPIVTPTGVEIACSIVNPIGDEIGNIVLPGEDIIANIIVPIDVEIGNLVIPIGEDMTAIVTPVEDLIGIVNPVGEDIGTSVNPTGDIATARRYTSQVDFHLKSLDEANRTGKLVATFTNHGEGTLQLLENLQHNNYQVPHSTFLPEEINNEILFETALEPTIKFSILPSNYPMEYIDLSAKTFTVAFDITW